MNLKYRKISCIESLDKIYQGNKHLKCRSFYLDL